MIRRLPLVGVRIHLSGSIPDKLTEEEERVICSFVQEFATKIFSEGGSIIHGSHPTLRTPLEESARKFISTGGNKDALTLVRAQKYAIEKEHLKEIEYQREYSVVQIIPGSKEDNEKSLVPMREWMSERSDVIVCFGGKWWDENKLRAGVPEELDATLERGKPAFVISSFGGAMKGYLDDDSTLLSRLHNGLSAEQNSKIAKIESPQILVEKIVTQLKLLPLIRNSVLSGRNFRILVLDGGGIRGTFTAAVLAKWDDMLKKGGDNNLVKHFDLVAGTSTGAILAIGLGLGLTPNEMLSFYKSKGSKIFPKNRKLRHWLNSKHDSQTLREILKEVLGENTLLSESCCKLVIPTVRAAHGETEVITTPHTEDRTGFHGITAVDAALASSAAPTYFDEAVVDSEIAVEKYLDGGIWANNPILPALAEAVRYLGIPLDRIDVLSIGTMGNESDFTKSLGKGKAGWAPESADLFFSAQEHSALIMAESFLGPARHLRINQQTPSEIKLDDTEAIEDMTTRGNRVAIDSFSGVRSRFLDGIYVEDWKS